MSQVYKCDRCGEILDAMTESNSKTHGVAVWDRNGFEEKYIICRNCYRDFGSWIKESKEIEAKADRIADAMTSHLTYDDRFIK